jgi:hypothetical protein
LDDHTVHALDRNPDGDPEEEPVEPGLLNKGHAPEVDMGLTFNFDYSDGSQVRSVTVCVTDLVMSAHHAHDRDVKGWVGGKLAGSAH